MQIKLDTLIYPTLYKELCNNIAILCDDIIDRQYITHLRFASILYAYIHCKNVVNKTKITGVHSHSIQCIICCFFVIICEI